jgi:hypothetical protein
MRNRLQYAFLVLVVLAVVGCRPSDTMKVEDAGSDPNDSGLDAVTDVASDTSDAGTPDDADSGDSDRDGLDGSGSDAGTDAGLAFDQLCPCVGETPTGTPTERLNVREQPDIGTLRVTTLDAGQTVTLTDYVEDGGTYSDRRTDWFEVATSEGRGWIAAKWVQLGECTWDPDATDAEKQQCGWTPPTGPEASDNAFGIGLVGPGSANDMQLAAELAGPGGHVKMIFPGVTRSTQGPQQAWVDAVNHAYASNLVPVIRVGPPWGDRNLRKQSDDAGNMDYTSLAQAYKRVVDGLPRDDDTLIWIEVHNEPNLCYEWVCDAGQGDMEGGSKISYQTIAAEYAAFLRDVTEALHSLNDEHIRVINGGLAPGGVRWCNCGSEGGEPGITAKEFLQAMEAGAPGVFDELDGWASHSYPASNEGYGFFVPFDQAGVGLTYYEVELSTIGRPNLPVLITETGWRTDEASRPQIADWTVRAFTDVWLPDSRVQAVMPFLLRGGSGWTNFEWVSGNTRHPVFNSVRSERCNRIPGNCP